MISPLQRPLLNTQHSQETNIHTPGGIQTHNLRKRVTANLRFTPRCHCFHIVGTNWWPADNLLASHTDCAPYCYITMDRDWNSCNVPDPYWDMGYVGEEKLKSSGFKDFPRQFHTIASLVLWYRRRIFLSHYMVSYFEIMKFVISWARKVTKSVKKQEIKRYWCFLIYMLYIFCSRISIKVLPITSAWIQGSNVAQFMEYFSLPLISICKTTADTEMQQRCDRDKLCELQFGGSWHRTIRNDHKWRNCGWKYLDMRKWYSRQL
jgi:hypothetical protein